MLRWVGIWMALVLGVAQAAPCSVRGLDGRVVQGELLQQDHAGVVIQAGDALISLPWAEIAELRVGAPPSSMPATPARDPAGASESVGTMEPTAVLRSAAAPRASVLGFGLDGLPADPPDGPRLVDRKGDPLDARRQAEDPSAFRRDDNRRYHLVVGNDRLRNRQVAALLPDSRFAAQYEAQRKRLRGTLGVSLGFGGSGLIGLLTAVSLGMASNGAYVGGDIARSASLADVGRGFGIAAGIGFGVGIPFLIPTLKESAELATDDLAEVQRRAETRRDLDAWLQTHPDGRPSTP